MSVIQVVLLSAVISAGAILVYDQVTQQPEPPDTGGFWESVEGQPEGDGARRLLAAQEQRIDSLEAALQALKTDLVGVRKAAAMATAGERAAPDDPDAPLDENDLDLLRLQVEELSRRRETERQAKMVARKLTMIGVTFSAPEHAAIQKRMIEFNVAVSAFWEHVREEAISDPDEIAAAYSVIRDRAESEVRTLVSAEKAEKVIEGFLRAGPEGNRRPPR